MTQNQVAYAGVEVQSKAQQETARHNSVAEQQNADAIQIQREAMQADRDYKRESLALEKEYKQLSLDIQKADVESQIWMRERQIQISELQQQADQRYKERVNEINAMEAANHKAQVEESIRHNKAGELFQAWSNLIENKKVEYQNTQFRENINLRRDELEAEKTKATLQYQASVYQTYVNRIGNAANNQTQLLINRERNESNERIAKETNTTMIITSGIHAAGEVIEGVAKGAGGFIGGAVNKISNDSANVMGNSAAQQAKRDAEALFSK